MASKMCFLADDKAAFIEDIVEFTYIKGMAFSQKQKNVLSFHSAIQSKYPNAKILEVSTKSQNELGIALSAFNLKLDGFYLESVFQSSKVFVNDVQFPELIHMHPKEAKQFIANSNSGALSYFKYNGVAFPLKPRSLFYDYLYVNALVKVPNISKRLIDFDIFTDIEFNEKKQINCQARSCAIYSYLLRNNQVDYYLSSVETFACLYPQRIEQVSLFDI